ncbi:hypothetical protein [Zhihengliuella sp.]|uniref:hypothetical protein n=1 Tax=Zhihengliuella sp. TaxID=1954483 RepID=UPI00281119C0|nr:hypothetical protein [Zhihengliuella sp.]
MALLGVVGALVALAQKARADRNNEWWDRTEFALQKSISEDPGEEVIGAVMMSHLVPGQRQFLDPSTWRKSPARKRDLVMVREALAEFDALYLGFDEETMVASGREIDDGTGQTRVYSAGTADAETCEPDSSRDDRENRP